MKCEDCIEIIEDYLDDALSDKNRNAFEDHMQDCSKCSNALENERLLSRQISEHLHSQAKSLSLSPDFKRDIRLASQSSSRRAIIWHHPWLIAAAASILVIIGISVWTQRTIQPASHIKCVATTYSEQDHEKWVNKTIVVRTKSRKDGYIRITATKQVEAS